jgi:hypothetical protein
MTVLPSDRRWAIGVAVAIAVFFILVIMAGTAYLPRIDDDFLLTHSDDMLEAQLALWLVRNDTKDIPIQVHPPVVEGVEHADGKILLQREFVANSSAVTLQVRSHRPVGVQSDSPPDSATLWVEVLHNRVPTHRRVLVIGPDKGVARTTELYPEDIDPVRIFSDTLELDDSFTKPLFGEGYSTGIREDIFTFSGLDDLWKIEVYDSVEGRTESFNGMALFKVRVRLVLGWEDGSEVSSDWMETQFFALDLVELPSA